MGKGRVDSLKPSHVSPVNPPLKFTKRILKAAMMDDPASLDSKKPNHPSHAVQHIKETRVTLPMATKNTNNDNKIPPEMTIDGAEDKIKLSWRSWIVVFVTCFAIVDQVFVVTAAGSVVAFIIRDLGKNEPNASGLAGWIIRMFRLSSQLP
jgi:hypothetical protein